jgi:hypothetical protein
MPRKETPPDQQAMIETITIHETNIHRPLDRAEADLKHHHRAFLCRSTQLFNTGNADNGFLKVLNDVVLRYNVKRNPLFSIPKANFYIGRMDRAVVRTGIQLRRHGDRARIDHDPFQITECRRLSDGMVSDAERDHDAQGQQYS